MGEVKRVKVVVLHQSYGCDTGCCGHIVTFPDGEESGFEFTHPYGDDHREWATKFALGVVVQKFGADHTADLDWERCEVSDD